MESDTFFESLFPRTVQLTVVHRQNPEESRLLGILRRIRVGKCERETSRDIQNLHRPIEDNEDTVHLYFTNLLVDAHNMSRLADLPGERVPFDATDSNDIRGISCPAPEVAYFKEGAPIMVPLNEKIRNGTRAVFVRKLDCQS